MKDCHVELKQLTKICVLADLTLMVAWSPEEAGRLIETYKIFENKPPDMIMEKSDGNPFMQVRVHFPVWHDVIMVVHSDFQCESTCRLE